MKLKLAVLLLSLLVPAVVRAQTNAPLSEAALAKAMDIVLRDAFKSPKEPETIFIFERFMDLAWLPEISNIEFVLIDRAQLKERGKVYFLNSEPVLKDGLLKVEFGFGDPFCSASGKTWSFHVTGDEVQQETGMGGGWGTGCSGANSTTKPAGK